MSATTTVNSATVSETSSSPVTLPLAIRQCRAKAALKLAIDIERRQDDVLVIASVIWH